MAALSGAVDPRTPGEPGFPGPGPAVAGVPPHLRATGRKGSPDAATGVAGANHRLHRFHGPRAGDRFGEALAWAGDVDGDGVGDWILGAPAARVGSEVLGRVIAVSGSDHRVLHEWLGSPQSPRLGGAVAGAGDLNQDGHGDLLIGVPHGGSGSSGPHPPSSGQGEVRLHSGIDGGLLHAWSGGAPGDQFGRALGSVADLDGDGVRDVIVGAPLADGGGTNAGEAQVFSGRDGSRLRTHRGGPFDQLGFAVAGLGDVNGDGRGDYAIGVPFADGAAFNGGEVRVHSGVDGQLLFRVQGSGAGDQFGFALDGGEDVNGDGVLDLAVAAPGADAAGFDSGAAQVLSGVDGAPLLTVAGPGPSTYLSAVALLGDVNGDGRGELITGCAGANGDESGQVQLVSGADGSSLWILHGPRALGWFGAAVAGGEDVNGDSLPDLLVGAPGHQDHGELVGFAEVLSAVPLP